MNKKITIEQALKELYCFTDKYIDYVCGILYTKEKKEKFIAQATQKYNVMEAMIGKCYHIAYKNNQHWNMNFKITDIIDKSKFIVNGFTYTDNGGDEGKPMIIALTNNEIPFFDLLSPYSKSVWTEIQEIKLLKLNSLFNEFANESQE